MNILFLEMEQQNIQLQKKLVQEGHTVVTIQEDYKDYYEHFGIECTNMIPYKQEYQEELGRGIWAGSPARVSQAIQTYDIDTVWCSCPAIRQGIMINESVVAETNFLAPTEQAQDLETSKIFARKFAEECGIKVPKLYESGEDHLSFVPDENIPEPFLLKPSNWWHSAAIVPNHGFWESYKNNWMPFASPYFCEEMIKGKETNISYIMSEGKWAFTFSESCDESKAKILGNVDPCAWFYGTVVEQLSPEEDQMVRGNVVEYLNQAAKLGGTYEGSITQMIGEDGELYFLENNVRPYVHNTFPIPFSGTEYLDAFINNPKKIGDWFEGRKFPKLVFQGGKEYPLHLNTKYNIAEPTGVTIEDGKFYVDSGAIITVFEDEINMDFVNELEKESDFKAYWGD